MVDWAYFAESTEQPDDDGSEENSADVDESLEARRLSRWLRAMFGGATKDEPEDRPER